MSAGVEGDAAFGDGGSKSSFTANGDLNVHRNANITAALTASSGSFTGTDVSLFGLNVSSGLFVGEGTAEIKAGETFIGADTEVSSFTAGNLSIPGDMSADGDYIQDGNTGQTTTCSAGETLDAGVFSGGIFTGGSCSPFGAGDMITSATQAVSGAKTYESSHTVVSDGRDIVLSTEATLGDTPTFVIDGSSGEVRFAGQISGNGFGITNVTVIGSSLVTNATAINTLTPFAVSTVTINTRGGRTLIGWTFFDIENLTSATRVYTVTFRRNDVVISTDHILNAPKNVITEFSFHFFDPITISGPTEYQIFINSDSATSGQEVQKRRITVSEH